MYRAVCVRARACVCACVCVCVCACGDFSKNKNSMFLFCTHSGVSVVLGHVTARLETRVLQPPDRHGPAATQRDERGGGRGAPGLPECLNWRCQQTRLH